MRRKRKLAIMSTDFHVYPISGLSPDLQSMEQIRKINRPTEIPDTGLLCDILWSDPDKEVEAWGENDRGVSFTFGSDVVSKFLNRHDLDLICRAHQVRFSWTCIGPIMSQLITRSLKTATSSSLVVNSSHCSVHRIIVVSLTMPVAWCQLMRIYYVLSR